MGVVAAAAIATQASVATKIPRTSIRTNRRKTGARGGDAGELLRDLLRDQLGLSPEPRSNMPIASLGDLWHVFRVFGTSTRWSALASLALSAFPALPDACSRFQSSEPAKEDVPFQITLVVVGEDKKPVPNASILSGTTVAATTGETGKAKLAFRGQEGTTVNLTIRCPAAYTSPSKPVAVGLRHLDPGSPAPRYEARCIRQTHSIVIGLRAQNGSNLPIIRLGQVIGKTDAGGEAHLLLQTIPNEAISLKLDTSGNEALRPESPNVTFMSKDTDEFVLLEQKFTVKKKIIPHVAKPRPIPL